MAIFIIIAVLLIISVIVSYNGLVKARNLTEEAESQIGVQLTRRADLIPNLVNTVKGYAKHEHDTFMDAIKARGIANGQTKDQPSLDDLEKLSNQMGDKKESILNRFKANQQATTALTNLFAVSESYPELKANQNFAKLQEELTTTENKVAASRTNYNRVIRDFNNKVETFPNNIFAKMFNFHRKEQLPTEERVKTVPNVEF